MSVLSNTNIIKKPMSPLAMAIVDDVSSFIRTNADYAAASQLKFSTQDGADAMAAAICYAISKAFARLSPAWAAAGPPVPPAVSVTAPIISIATAGEI